MEAELKNEFDLGVKVTLKSPDAFLLCKETLTRIGVASKKNKTLYQSCHILHKKGNYYILHFKELFKLDGKPNNISEEDINRRNLIVSLLLDWDLLSVDEPEKIKEKANISSVKVLSFKDKSEWTQESKYTIGSNKY